jgi:murein DD-endopeptidase MepM/ murein hydrolase activator NlpD
VAPAPRITRAQCAPRPRKPCSGSHSVVPGGRVRIGGRYLGGVAKAIFFGNPGRADNATGKVLRHRKGAIDVSVPRRARSGPIAVVSRAGARSQRWSGLTVQPVTVAPSPSDGVSDSSRRKVFYGGLQKPTFNFQVGGDHPVDVQVSVTRLSDQRIVQTWTLPQVAPGAAQNVVWDGTAGGKVQPDGQYYFSLPGATASGLQGQDPAGPDNSFAFYGHMFPIAGKHRFALGAGRFGAPRPGHTHQGQDVLAACGTPLVAARAGRVVYSGYHALAGYYLVIQGKDSGLDYGYMHLRDPSLVRTHDSVYTGQPIGYVGQTGDATGCHLHFELWTAPGWYKGGHPFDPLPNLRAWDRVS